MFRSCLTVVLLLEKGPYPENSHVLYSHIRLALFLNFHVFRFCLKTLAVILVSDFFSSGFSEKETFMSASSVPHWGWEKTSIRLYIKRIQWEAFSQTHGIKDQMIKQNGPVK